MWTHRRASICAGIVFLTLTRLSYAASGDFFVDPQGKDTAAGSAAAPFATIGRAQRAVRERIAAGLKSDVRVVIRGGEYQLSEPLVFGPEDSGTTEHAIIYTAADGQTPIVSGGRTIHGWQREDADVWSTTVPALKQGQWKFRELYRSGKRLRRSRYPDEGFLRIESVSTDLKTLTFEHEFPAGRLNAAEIVVIENWALTRDAVSGWTRKSVSSTAGIGMVGFELLTARAKKPAFLEGAASFLHRPSDWAADPTTGEVKIKVMPGERLSDEPVEAPVLEQLVAIRGTPGALVRRVRFEGITFAYCNWNLPDIGYADVQAGHFSPKTGGPTYVLPGAVEMDYAESCALKDCRVVHAGACGVVLGAGCRYDAVAGTEVSDAGGNGIMVGWRGRMNPDGTLPAMDADWKDPKDVPEGNVISDCHIHDCGVMDWGCVGIWVGFTRTTQLLHNLLSDLPYTGISLGFRWNSNPSSQGGALVEGNSIHHVMRDLADGGGIYTLGYQPGTVLRANVIRDVHRSSFAIGGAPNNGFFVDEGSKGFLFDRNWVYNAPGGAVRFNKSERDWHTFQNNHFEEAKAKDEAGGAKVEAAAGAGPRGLYKARFAGAPVEPPQR